MDIVTIFCEINEVIGSDDESFTFNIPVIAISKVIISNECEKQ